MTFHIYEKHPEADAYRVGAGYTGYAILAVDKRFTEAELAAEHYRAISMFQSADDMAELMPGPETWCELENARSWMFLTEHFALSNHFDE